MVTCVHIHAHLQSHTHIIMRHGHKRSAHMKTCTCAYTCTYVHAHMHVRVHVHMHAHIHDNVHVHMPVPVPGLCRAVPRHTSLDVVSRAVPRRWVPQWSREPACALLLVCVLRAAQPRVQLVTPDHSQVIPMRHTTHSTNQNRRRTPVTPTQACLRPPSCAVATP